MALQIIQDFIAKGRNNRPAFSMIPEGNCIHETGSFAAGADAKAHSIYIKSDAAASRPASWHFTVDSKFLIYQHLPTNENGWHAGDGGSGRGNRFYIGIEMCVNLDGDYEQTLRNTIWLCRHLIETVPSLKQRITSPALLQQHFHFSGKNCPQRLRSEGRWNWFVGEIMKKESGDSIMIKDGSKVKFKASATTYATGTPLPLSVRDRIFTVAELGSPWGTTTPSARLEEINSWARVVDLELANPPQIVCGNCAVKDAKIKELEANIKSLQTTNNNMVTTLQARTTEIAKLKDDFKVQNQSILDNAKVIQELRSINLSLVSEKDYLEKRVADREVIIDDYKERNDVLTQLTERLENEKASCIEAKTKLELTIEERLNAVTQEYEDKLLKEKLKKDYLQDRVNTLEKELKPIPVTIDWKDASAMDLIIHAIKKMFGKD